MSQISSPRAISRPTGGRTRTRRRDGSRKLLLGATALVTFGSFLPWIDTGIGSISGMRGAGLWTFYAAMLGMAGALVPSRRLAAVQGLLLGVIAVALPTWQVVHLLELVGTAGWRPGPGLVMVFGGGVLALVSATRLLRGPVASEEAQPRST